jgi:hypothetical protein
LVGRLLLVFAEDVELFGSLSCWEEEEEESEEIFEIVVWESED